MIDTCCLYFLKEDLLTVVNDLQREGVQMDAAWFEPHYEFRMPIIGHVTYDGVASNCVLRLNHGTCWVKSPAEAARFDMWILRRAIAGVRDESGSATSSNPGQRICCADAEYDGTG